MGRLPDGILSEAHGPVETALRFPARSNSFAETSHGQINALTRQSINSSRRAIPCPPTGLRKGIRCPSPSERLHPSSICGCFPSRSFRWPGSVRRNWPADGPDLRPLRPQVHFQASGSRIELCRLLELVEHEVSLPVRDLSAGAAAGGDGSERTVGAPGLGSGLS